ncbi:hypothetical protein RHGRI_021387 [Rhododendron griersonianum]|uniref:Transposase MuDR plant domain-containing protein n=1 Tax=Rhododendron griersonianum TaxID=479676 RepID=A0AAV6JN60_9ERIC|nr:hypothetical protein RHGRI_021387 [Rhododendron griersonianum]
MLHCNRQEYLVVSVLSYGFERFIRAFRFPLQESPHFSSALQTQCLATLQYEQIKLILANSHEFHSKSLWVYFQVAECTGVVLFNSQGIKYSSDELFSCLSIQWFVGFQPIFNVASQVIEDRSAVAEAPAPAPADDYDAVTPESAPLSTTGMAWILRAPNGFKPKYSSPEYFTIKLNHDGNLVKEDMLEYYVGGTVNYFDFCDNDRISRTELRAICKEVGYVEEVSLYYRVCHLDGKWVFNIFQTDSDVTSMVQSLNNDLLELYLVNSHLEGSTKVEHNKYVDVEDGLLDIDITSWEWDCGSFSQDNYTCMDLSTHIPSTRENPSPTKEPPPINEPQPTSRQNQPPTTGRRRRRHLDHDSNSESDFDFDVFIDSDYDLSEDDDALFDANVDKEIEWTGVRQKRVVRSDILHDCLSETESEEGDSSDGFMSFDSASSDEDGKKKPKFRKYRPVLGKVQPIIEEKMIFKNRAQCVEAIRQHAIVNGKEITFEKNDTDRVRAHCATNCPWKILASSITTDRITLQVKTYNPNHDCGWMWTNKLLNSRVDQCNE